MQATLQPIRAAGKVDANAGNEYANAGNAKEREREESVRRRGSREIWSIRDIFDVWNNNLVLFLIDINSYYNMQIKKLIRLFTRRRQLPSNANKEQNVLQTMNITVNMHEGSPPGPAARE